MECISLKPTTSGSIDGVLYSDASFVRRFDDASARSRQEGNLGPWRMTVSFPLYALYVLVKKVPTIAVLATDVKAPDGDAIVITDYL